MDWAPEGLQPLVGHFLSIVLLISVFSGFFALTTWVERKALGRIQNRLGPNRVGPVGILQPIADGLKMIFKEDIVPRSADKVIHFLAPVLLVVPTFLAFSVLPYGQHLVPINLDAGILFFFAIGSATELTVFMAGWASRNKYAMLGAMRAIAQMISYEVPLILSSVTVIMMAGSLSLVDIVTEQSGGFWHWYVATPWGITSFVLFLTSALAESNRSPFDIPEAESEIIAGHMTEYSGFKYALFFLAEYLGLFAMSGLAVTLFLGGFHPPLSFLDFVPGPLWFFAKFACLIALFIWIRGTLPRLRMDQLMNLAWKFILPMTLVTFAAAAAWHYAQDFSPLAAWAICVPLIVIPYLTLGKRLGQSQNVTKRAYRFAD
ncbi:MAG: NADH-quinone oxidoreductase subunit H [Verrucomicrobia subdivision 3 bacterium]|nr:NADH-quinone oxidoreductase subunit H [Limisphaerales bacterium]MCS1414440.1 NADH-quinone oxidoreductase subunit H [Limisphaerales bacterium]